MGFDPQEVAHIRMAYDRGLGETDDIEVLGESVSSIMRKFKRA
jgi:uncharacterized protein (DUF362 family)